MPIIDRPFVAKSRPRAVPLVGTAAQTQGRDRAVNMFLSGPHSCRGVLPYAGRPISSAMPCVRRDSEGRIASLHRKAETPAPEFLPAQHSEVRAFIGLGAAADDSSGLDAEIARVLEDLIDTLIARNVIAVTDLPEQGQAKPFAHKSYRERAGRNASRLFDDGFGPIIDDSQRGDLR